MSREAIEEAIEVLEDASAEMLMETGDKNYYIEAIAVLRQALVDADDTSQERVDEIVKDEHEPVAWANSPADGPVAWSCQCGRPYTVTCISSKPQKKEWVGLTDEQIIGLWQDTKEPDGHRIERFAHAIEQALKEKNNG